jgi:H+/Cl- antiporter ClcA
MGMTVGKWILIAGVALVAVGAVLILLEKIGLGLGRLPGDFSLGGRNWRVYFPLATSVILSIALTLILLVLSRMMRR